MEVLKKAEQMQEIGFKSFEDYDKCLQYLSEVKAKNRNFQVGRSQLKDEVRKLRKKLDKMESVIGLYLLKMFPRFIFQLL